MLLMMNNYAILEFCCHHLATKKGTLTGSLEIFNIQTQCEDEQILPLKENPLKCMLNQQLFHSINFKRKFSEDECLTSF